MRGEHHDQWKSGIGLALLTLALFIRPDGLPGQTGAEEPLRFQESVSLETDSAVAKKLATVEDHVAEEQWDQALAILEQTASAHGETLIAVSPGRYVNVARYCNLVLGSLPADALAQYRSQVDPLARRWLKEAEKQHNAEELQKLLQKAFLSSFGDEALFRLGEWAWQRGEIEKARHYWTQMLPLRQQGASGEPLPALRYPDADRPAADIRARLVLCSLAQGDRTRARRELNAFKQLHPQATGRLGGQEGNWGELLADALSDTEKWAPPASSGRPRTFAINRRRNGRAAEPVSVGTRQWRIPLPRDPYWPADQPPAKNPAPLSFHPVVWKRWLFVNTADRILAYDGRTGEPAWPAGEKNPARIYPEGPQLPPARSDRPSRGTPHYTMSLQSGRLYARMGPPITARAGQQVLRDLSSEIVCLDVGEAEGKLLWKVSSKELGSNWAFEGAPLVVGSRLYVALRKGHSQRQAHVAAFNADSGELLWNRKVCASLRSLGEGRNHISHQLLTWGNETLFYATHMGAIAALDGDTGRLHWVVTYPSRQPVERRGGGLLPCLFHRGTVFCAPRDSQQVMALDAASGMVLWQQGVNDRIEHVLGVGGGNLIVGGRSVWGLDSHTGAVTWGSPVRDPEFAGYGRGVLVGDEVWWPRHEVIEILDQRTGRPARLPVSLAAKGATGGNLAVLGGRLLVAGARHVRLFNPYSGLFRKGSSDSPSPASLSLGTLSPGKGAFSLHPSPIGRGAGGEGSNGQLTTDDAQPTTNK